MNLYDGKEQRIIKEDKKNKQNKDREARIMMMWPGHESTCGSNQEFPRRMIWISYHFNSVIIIQRCDHLLH